MSQPNTRTSRMSDAARMDQTQPSVAPGNPLGPAGTAVAVRDFVRGAAVRLGCAEYANMVAEAVCGLLLADIAEGKQNQWFRDVCGGVPGASRTRRVRATRVMDDAPGIPRETHAGCTVYVYWTQNGRIGVSVHPSSAAPDYDAGDGTEYEFEESGWAVPAF